MCVYVCVTKRPVNTLGSCLKAVFQDSDATVLDD